MYVFYYFPVCVCVCAVFVLFFCFFMVDQNKAIILRMNDLHVKVEKFNKRVMTEKEDEYFGSGGEVFF